MALDLSYADVICKQLLTGNVPDEDIEEILECPNGNMSRVLETTLFYSSMKMEVTPCFDLG